MTDTTLPVASPLKARAKRHIDDKLRILDSWVVNGIPWKKDDATGQSLLDDNDEKMLDYFPTDIKAFALWDGSKNCSVVRAELGQLHRCSRTTISQPYHAQLREQIDETLDKLKSKSVSQLDTSNKSLTIARQEDETTYLKKVIARQENDVVELTIRRHEAIKKLRDEKDMHRRNRKEWKEEKEQLEAKISELTKTLRKVVSLKTGKVR